MPTVAVRSLVEPDAGPRALIDPTHVARLAERLRAGATFPPILADRKTRTIVDGVHRCRAAAVVHGRDATVHVLWKTYESAAEMLADAAAHNVRHGKPLSPFEELQVAIRLEDLGLSRDRICEVLGWQRETLDARLLRRTALSPDHLTRVALKPAVSHLAGSELTAAQMAANKHLGGHHAFALAGQLLLLLQANAIDGTNPRIVERLAALDALLHPWVAEHTIAKSA
jgi:ParB-like chromosome segregation protein Spo0J